MVFSPATLAGFCFSGYRALTQLIQTRYPKDSLHVVLFGDDAWEVKIRDIPYASVAPITPTPRPRSSSGSGSWRGRST